MYVFQFAVRSSIFAGASVGKGVGEIWAMDKGLTEARPRKKFKIATRSRASKPAERQINLDLGEQQKGGGVEGSGVSIYNSISGEV